MIVRQQINGPLSTTCLLGILSALTWVRVGSLQLEDILLLLLLAYCSAKFAYSVFCLRIPLVLHSLFKSYSLLLFSLVVMSVLSLRLPFYPLDEPTFLQKPLLFSLARLLQFVSVVYGFLWLTGCLLRRPALLVPAMSAYWITGVVSSLYSVACYVAAAFLHVVFSADSIGGVFQAQGSIRARGFFNEGGPFGIYLVSVILVGLLRRHLTGRRLNVLGIVILATGFLLSASIAGLLVMIVLLAIFTFMSGSLRQRLSYALLATLVIVGAGSLLDLRGVLEGYIESFQEVDQQIDPALATGRVAAYYIVPRMIAAHPVTGIGLGNYPFMRNDPLYRGPLPAVTFINDLPAFGIPGLAAELGLPITLWLLILICTPYWRLRKYAPIVAVAAAFQPVAHGLGVQVTFFYPWFVTACALAAADAPSYSRVRLQQPIGSNDLRQVLPAVAKLADL